MSRPLYIYGAGGHARVILATATAAGIEGKGVFDDDPDKAGSTVDGCPIVGAFDRDLVRDADLVLAIGDNRTRQRIAGELGDSVNWGTLIHPHAIVDRTVEIAEGTVVFAGVIIQPGTSVGRHVIINTAATIDHDCMVGSFAHVAPGVHVAGHVDVGDGALLGIGASVVPGVAIGPWAKVGAGAGVTRDVGDHRTVVGVPARDLYAER